MSRRTRRACPPDMKRVQRRIEHWRRTRPKRRGMPEKLWEAAVAVAHKHGINTASRTLRVNYGALKSRLMATGPAPGTKRKTSKPARGAAFIELGAPLPFGNVSGGPVVELTDSDGRKLAVRLAAGDELDLVGLAREFWSRPT